MMTEKASRTAEQLEVEVKATQIKKPRGKNGVRCGQAVTVYLDSCWPAYTKLCKAIGQSASSRLSNLMKADLEKLGGGSSSEALNTQRISELELLLAENTMRGKKIQSMLIQEKVFSDIDRLTVSWKLDELTFGNLKAITRRLLEYKPNNSDRFNRDDLLLFCSMLKLAAQKVRLQTELRSLLLIDSEPLAGIQPTIANAESANDVPPSDSVPKIDLGVKNPHSSQTRCIAKIEPEKSQPEIQAEPVVPSASEVMKETETESEPEEEQDEENLEDRENQSAQASP
jgi:hypothetical protein